MSAETTVLDQWVQGSLRFGRNTLAERLKQLQEAFRKQGDPVQADKMGQLADKWIAGEFVLAFCGHFSAGKSTMINTLMGKEILPSSPIPTSANVVKIKAGEPKAIACFKNKPDLTLHSVEEVKEYCKNGEEVETVEIYHPNDFLVNGACILDTPGIDSTDAAHKVATESAMHLADVVVYMMDYNHVQSEVNFRFTKLLKEKGKTLYLVINQIDKHFDEELDFRSFRKSVEEAFEQWGIYADGIYYTTLKYPNHPNNQIEALHDRLYSLFFDKHRIIQESVVQSALQLISDHVDVMKSRHQKKREEWLEVIGSAVPSEIKDSYAALRQEMDRWDHAPRQLREELMKELASLLENANLTPFTTRELAGAYLESCQPGFKVGFLFASKKTEQEKQARLAAFHQEVAEQIRVNLQGHLIHLLVEVPKKFGLTLPADLRERMDHLSFEARPEFLASLVKTGARVTGESILNYCRDMSQEIKSHFRRLALPFIDEITKLLEMKAESHLEQLKNQHQQVMEINKAMEGLEQLDQKEQQIRHELTELLVKPEEKERETEFIPEEGVMSRPIRQWRAEGAGSHVNQARMESLELPAEEIGTFPYKGDFKAKLGSAAYALRKAAAIIEEMKGQAYAAAQMRLRADRLEKQMFTVALFGAFSAGKSSFANAMMGEMILPVSPNPTTATINKILPPTSQFPHGTVRVKIKSEDEITKDILQSLAVFEIHVHSLEEAVKKIEGIEADQILPSAKPHYSFLLAVKKGLSWVEGQWGEELRVGMEDFKELVAKEEKACFVEWIELYYDCPLTQQGISLVDTPGADSINARHTGVAFDYIKNADAILFVTYYNHAFSHADQAFLQQLGRVKDSFEMDKMFFLVNAADLASSKEELQGVLQHVKENLLKCGIRNPRLYPVSSQTALLARMLEAGKLTDSGKEVYKQRTRREDRLMSPKEAIAFSGFQTFESEFIRFTIEELTEVAIQSAINEIKRSRNTVQAFLNSAREDEQERKRKSASLREAREKDLSYLSSYRSPSEEKQVHQELKEHLFFVKQRLLFNLNELFSHSFNPSVLKEDGRDLKKTAAQCFDELMRNVSFTLSQEMRATSLRMEKALNQLIQQVHVHFHSRLHAELEVQHQPVKLAVPSFPEEVEYDKSLTKPLLAYFKSPKQFFEQGGREQMREALEKRMMEPVSAYLEQCLEQMSRYYQISFDQMLNNLKNEWIYQVQEYYTGMISSLEDQIDINHLEAAYLNLGKIMDVIAE